MRYPLSVRSELENVAEYSTVSSGVQEEIGLIKTVRHKYPIESNDKTMAAIRNPVFFPFVDFTLPLMSNFLRQRSI